MEPRAKDGKFAPKSDAERQVRSIRTTERVWNDFGFEADRLGITRADLLERWVKGESLVSAQVPTPIQALEAVAVLEQALTLKANAGGAIKTEIRRALDLLT